MMKTITCFFYRNITILSVLLVFLSLPAKSNNIITGAEQTEVYLPLIKGKRVGIVANQASVIGKEVNLVDSLLKLNVNIVTVFAPEHGFLGREDSREPVKDRKYGDTNIPVISLYGVNEKPTAKQMAGLDVLVFDLQDVGVRFYTYISTMHYAMEACVENNKEFIVLDRPNPCDYVDGPVLKPAFKSFAGVHEIPLLHGCTVGELAKMINGQGWLKKKRNPCKLTVVKVKNWKHGEPYSPPLKPSPNLPNDQAIRLYPSLCAFEATRISVGRGTTHPFQVLGGLDRRNGGFTFIPQSLDGFDKTPLHQGKTCYGVDLRGDNSVKGFTLKFLIEYYKKSRLGPSFFVDAKHMDQLMGTDAVRKDIIAGKSEEQIRASWTTDLNNYKKIRSKYLLY